jgi:hypothetical protein
MNSIPEMVARLQANSVVVGLIEYGSARHGDPQIDGDYDLIAVVAARDPDVESLHFRVGGVPIDLNIRSLDDIRSLDRADGFDTILLDGRIIHDPSGHLEKEIEELRQRASVAQRGHSGLDVAGMRHGHQHILDKVRNRHESMPTLASYVLYQGVYWLVRQYFEIRNLDFQGDRRALEFIQEHEPAVFEALEAFYRTSDLGRQSELFRTMAEMVLAPIGGLWREEEILTFGDEEKGRALFGTLFHGAPGE